MVRRVIRAGMRQHSCVRLRSWAADQSGFAALEFALVALPFIVLLFGTISICLFFFTTFTVENAVWQASRAIRTGQYQQGQGAYSGYPTDEDRKKAFKRALCAKAPPYLDCEKAVLLVQSNSGGFGSIAPPACATNGTMIDPATAEFSPGTADSVVLITVCYPWAFGAKLPFLTLNNALSDGSLLIQASVAFRTEPYPSN